MSACTSSFTAPAQTSAAAAAAVCAGERGLKAFDGLDLQVPPAPTNVLAAAAAAVQASVG
jgi:hypothetical protein